MASHSNKVAERFVTPIDAMELAVRLAESYNGMKRPEGATASAAFFSMERASQDAWMTAATAAMDYWRECINQMQRTN